MAQGRAYWIAGETYGWKAFAFTMQEVIRQLMGPDDALEAFSQIGVKDPDVARVTVEATVAAPVNVQSVMAIDTELKHRARRN